MKRDPHLLADLEEAVVEFLLVRYGLDQMRARFMILDIQEQFHPVRERLRDREPPPLHLSVLGWMKLFPSYPVWIEAKVLSDSDSRKLRLDQPALVHYSPVIRRFVERAAARPEQPRLAWVLLPPRVSKMAVHDMPVLHLGPIQTQEVGVHSQIIMPDGVVVCTEPLYSLMRYVDDHHPRDDWLGSATCTGWDEHCPRRRR